MTKEIEENNNKDILRIFVIRHGQTDYNAKKILQGHIDVDINENGRSQAEKAGKALKDVKLDGITTSDLVRCRNTTDQLLKYQDEMDVTVTPNVRERHKGPAQGMYLKDASEKYGSALRELGEPKEEFIGRVESEWNDVIKRSKTNGYLNYAICTHGGVVTSFTHYLYDLKQYKLGKDLTPDKLKVPFNSSITVIDIDKNTGDGIIQIFGNTDHLGGHFEVKEQLLR